MIWREFREFLRIRATIRLSADPALDQKHMADLVGTPGYQALKALMMTTAIQVVASEGNKPVMGPGLARAVGVIAECERVHHELTRKAKAEAKGKPEPEDDED